MAPSIIATDPGNYVLKRRFSGFFCLVGWGFWWGFFPSFLFLFLNRLPEEEMKRLLSMESKIHPVLHVPKHLISKAQ